MSAYRDDRRGLLARIAQLETELARAERRAEHHVVDALRVGEFENENVLLRRKLQEFEGQRTPLMSLRPWVAGVTVTIFVLLVAVIVLARRASTSELAVFEPLQPPAGKTQHFASRTCVREPVR